MGTGRDEEVFSERETPSIWRDRRCFTCIIEMFGNEEGKGKIF
jgi:hypothetical protein